MSTDTWQTIAILWLGAGQMWQAGMAKQRQVARKRAAEQKEATT